MNPLRERMQLRTRWSPATTSRTEMRLPRPELTRGAWSRKLGERSQGEPQADNPKQLSSRSVSRGEPGAWNPVGRGENGR